MDDNTNFEVIISLMSGLAERVDHVSEQFADAYRQTKPAFLLDLRGPWQVWYPEPSTMAETGAQQDAVACWSQLTPSILLFAFNQHSQNKSSRPLHVYAGRLGNNCVKDKFSDSESLDLNNNVWTW